MYNRNAFLGEVETALEEVFKLICSNTPDVVVISNLLNQARNSILRKERSVYRAFLEGAIPSELRLTEGAHQTIRIRQKAETFKFEGDTLRVGFSDTDSLKLADPREAYALDKCCVEVRRVKHGFDISVFPRISTFREEKRIVALRFKRKGNRVIPLTVNVSVLPSRVAKDFLLLTKASDVKTRNAKDLSFRKYQVAANNITLTLNLAVASDPKSASILLVHLTNLVNVDVADLQLIAHELEKDRNIGPVDLSQLPKITRLHRLETEKVTLTLKHKGDTIFSVLLPALPAKLV